jgi:hypothetical protein
MTFDWRSGNIVNDFKGTFGFLCLPASVIGAARSDTLSDQIALLGGGVACFVFSFFWTRSALRRRRNRCSPDDKPDGVVDRER